LSVLPTVFRAANRQFPFEFLDPIGHYPKSQDINSGSKDDAHREKERSVQLGPNTKNQVCD
jgi:hypothetical protein